MAGVGPGPMCSMLLADLGATVLRVDRTFDVELGTRRELRYNLVLRNRQSIALDLKQPAAVELVLRLLENADGLIDPFRPGVLERLGLGPDVCEKRNPRLVYGRMTGWGQTGPMAGTAGHDLNYIALSGVLHSIGRNGQPPTPPLNLLGDYGGGAMYLALGMLSALLETRSSGRGQVVDVAMAEGSASLATHIYGAHAAGQWNARRGTNSMDSGAPYYEVYACADGKWLSVAAVEDRFYRELLGKLGLDSGSVPDRNRRENWGALRDVLAKSIASRTRDEWAQVFEGSDACVAPVLDFDEAPRHPQAVARGSFVEVDGVTQPAPTPRFSRTVPQMPRPPIAARNQDVETALDGWLSGEEIDEWRGRGLLRPR